MRGVLIAHASHIWASEYANVEKALLRDKFPVWTDFPPVARDECILIKL
jgi:hypothetical protein